MSAIGPEQVAAPKDKVHTAAQALGGGTNVGSSWCRRLNKDYELLPKQQRLYLPCHDPHYGQAIGMVTSHNFSNIL